MSSLPREVVHVHNRISVRIWICFGSRLWLVYVVVLDAGIETKFRLPLILRLDLLNQNTLVAVTVIVLIALERVYPFGHYRKRTSLVSVRRMARLRSKTPESPARHACKSYIPTCDVSTQNEEPHASYP
jgi:hypothetical protein